MFVSYGRKQFLDNQSYKVAHKNLKENITIFIGLKNNPYENFAKQKRVSKDFSNRNFRDDGSKSLWMYIG